MFDTLSDKLQATLGDLRGHGRLSEENLSKAMREIRLALLEADVNFQVVRDFVARVRERAAGAEVTKSLTPAQEVVRIVHEELRTASDSYWPAAEDGSRPATYRITLFRHAETTRGGDEQRREGDQPPRHEDHGPRDRRLVQAHHPHADAENEHHGEL